MDVDKEPKPLNDEAWKIAKELDDFVAPVEIMLSAKIRLEGLRSEIRDALKALAEKMRKTAEDGETRTAHLKEETRKKMEKSEEKRQSIFKRIREVHPELDGWEFGVNASTKEYTLSHKIGEKDPDDEKEETESKAASEEDKKAAKMVEELLARIGEKK